MFYLYALFISILTIALSQPQQSSQLLAEFKMTSNQTLKTGDLEIDGLLNESVWDDAIRLDQFTQSSPQLGVPATERTEVSVRYDHSFLYVGIKAFDQNPSLIFASVLGRDEILQSDDYLEVIIDSYNDKANALAFATNPLGTRVDYEISQNGSNFNPAWNTFWEVSSQLTDFGWSAEYKIPWSSLRYEAKPVNTMAFKVIRYIKHKNEKDIFPLKNQEISNLDYHMENTQEIDIEGLQDQNPLYFVPYVSSNIEQNYELNEAETGYTRTANGISRKNYVESSGLDKILSNIGFDLKYKLNNNNTLDITVNTDFAQAEADDRIVNISRFSIFQPEKRSFFLENANLFQSRLTFNDQLFHSRTIGIEEDLNGDNQIVPIIAGLRLSGKVNQLEYGIMNLQGKSDNAQGIDALNYTVIRPKYSISSDDSYIGALMTSKQSMESNTYNRVVSVDSKIGFGQNIYLKTYTAGSFDHDLPQTENLAYGI